MPLKTIILAAGKGERLGPLTRNMPKSLLEIGMGVTVIETQLDNLARAGIEDVVLVVGYKAEQIEAKVRDYRRLRVHTVYNPFFDVSNNLVSAWMARDHMRDDFLLVNGDVVFSWKLPAALGTRSDPIVMMIDRKDAYDDDDMKVVTENQRVYDVSKTIPLDRVNGESIGMIGFREHGREAFRNKLDAMVRRAENRGVFYLAALKSLMDESYPVGFHECGVDDWGEIDFHPDLELIRTNVERYGEKIQAWSR